MALGRTTALPIYGGAYGAGGGENMGLAERGPKL
jgi:hypothetical protein